MLVLGRFPQQEIIIGKEGNIKITIIGTNKFGEVRVGIEAPRTIPVHRKEVYDDIKKDRETDHAHKSLWSQFLERKNKIFKRPLVPTRGPPS